MYLNKVFLYGNLTRDPELKSLPSGSQVVNFSIATNRTYKDKSGAEQKTTEFHNLVAFGRPAEVIAQYMKKGRGMFIEGRLQTRSWDGPDGQKKYKTEIMVEQFQFGPGGGSSFGGGQGEEKSPKEENSQEAPAIQYPEEEIKAEDIPF